MKALNIDEAKIKDTTTECANQKQAKIDAAKKAEDEKKKKAAEDEKKKKAAEDAKKKKPADKGKKSMMYEALLISEADCEAFEKNLPEFNKLKGEKEPITKKIDGFTKEINKLQTDLDKLNPLLDPATTDTIKTRILAEKNIFLVSEVTKESDLISFEKFSTKLGKEILNLETLKESEKDTADRVKADNMAIKFLKDFKEFIDTKIIKPMKADADSFKFPTSEFDAAEAQYYHDFIKSSILQASTLKALDAPNAAKYDTFIAKYQKEQKQSKGDLQDGGKTDDSITDYLIIGGIGLFTIVGTFFAYYKCKNAKKTTDNKGGEYDQLK